MYRLIFVLIIPLICICQSAFSQQREFVESKLSLFNDVTQPDSIRFQAIVRLTMSQLSSQPDSALKYAQKMYDLAQSKSESRLMSYALNYKGIAHGYLGQHKKAIQVFHENLHLAKKFVDEEMMAGTYINLGNRYNSLKLIKEAIKNHELGIDLAEKIGDHEYQANGLTNLAQIYYDQSAYQKALACHQMAYTLYDKINNKDGLGKSTMMLGNIYYAMGDLEKSSEFLLQSKDYYAEVRHAKNIAGNLINLGRNYTAAGDYQTSLGFYQEGIKLLEEIGDKPFLSVAKLNMSHVYKKMGNYQDAIRLNNESRAIKIELNDTLGIAMNQRELAHLYVSNDDLEEAIHVAEKSKEISSQIGHRMGEAEAIDIIAAAFQKRKAYQEALKTYAASKAIYEEINSKQHIAANDINVGAIYEKLGQDAKALTLLVNGIRVCRELNQLALLGDGLKHLGNLHYNNQEYKKSIPLHTEALKIAQNANNTIDIRDIAQALYWAYKISKQSHLALPMYELHIQMRDSIQNIANQKAVMKQQLQYSYDRQKAIDDAENEGRLKIEQEKIRSQRRLSIAIGVGLMASLLLTFFAMNRWRITKKQKIIIEKQKVEAEQSEKFKERFLANMSHEIRTPMHAISGMTNILKRNPHPKDQEVYLDAMQQSASNLLVILNDILDLSKIEAGKINIKSQPFSLGNTINHVHELLKPHAAEKNLNFEVNVDHDLPVFVLGDQHRMTQVLVNLVGNAIKFTEEGSVGLYVLKKNNKLHIQVKDTGIGILPENIDRIFGSFEQMQVDGQLTSGTGLGLNIAKQLIELQHGRIWVESQVNQGSTFFIDLPLIEAEEVVDTSITPEQFKGWTESLKGSRMLIVEDDEFNLMVITDDLKYHIKNIQIDVAKNGKEGVAKAAKIEYDIILMDIDMSGINGHEATKAIRKEEQDSNSTLPTPIIATTASLMESEIQKCYDVGMTDYIPKPYNIEHLMQTLAANVKIDEPTDERKN